MRSHVPEQCDRDWPHVPTALAQPMESLPMIMLRPAQSSSWKSVPF
jgi:hypothetical protein